MDRAPDYGDQDNAFASSSRITLLGSVSSVTSHESPVIPPLPENTVLTWDGEELYGPEPVVLAQTGSSSQARPSSPPIPLILPPRSPSPPERPPEYSQAQRPTKSVRYSFSPMGNNAMVLIPPADAQDTRPRYYITVSMNCFMPPSHITTIYRGANEYGSAVAEFEMGIIAAANRFRFGNLTESINTFLGKEGSRTHAKWRWTIPGRNGGIQPNCKLLTWDYTRRPCICTLHPSNTRTLAKFAPQLGINVQRLLSQLEVTPEGQDFFDHILLSLLIIERKRLTPGREAALKTLFN